MARVTTDFTDADISKHVFLIILLVPGIECITGMIGNGFIMTTNAVEWFQNKRLSTSDSILMILSCLRLLLQFWMMVENTYSLLFRFSYIQNTVYNTFKVIFMFLTYSNLWFAAWLNVFYCIKIANFTHPLFLRLRWRITGLMPWLLCLSVLVSLCCSLPILKDVYNIYVNASIPVPSSNATEKKYFAETNVANFAIIYNLGIFIPLIMFISAATLLIISLKRHTLQMKSNATGSRNPSMEAHLGAIKAISFFLFLYIFNFVALIFYMSNVLNPNSFGIILCKIIMAAYPAGHAVLLIFGNPKLRRSWKKLQHNVKFNLKVWK
ncbi:taste receptor type 2 member 40-like [Dromiciops gliroides]|uniref:taste receptor type 2 member 40-like n=1 Tax=Dromiciops gliroides TaxID=33562 RepID=UPI001CC7B73D|nr:taste receptor type 2 member 40-like [Dromiciops gliroides]